MELPGPWVRAGSWRKRRTHTWTMCPEVPCFASSTAWGTQSLAWGAFHHLACERAPIALAIRATDNGVESKPHSMLRPDVIPELI